MYLTFFGLVEKPFAITPDPRYLYLSARHADALAHLLYGINEAGGFIQLTGEVGTGKTTIIRSLLARAPKHAEIALILNPRLSAEEFLHSLCEELGLGINDQADANTKELVDVLNRYLLRMHARGRRVVLMVDEAQNLAPEVLEQIRLLTNLETETQKLLQIILIGQPELRTLLAREDLRQLAQRITGRYHLDPLSREETAAYVRHRMRVAGATSEVFGWAALRAVYRVSGGIPRVINIICDRALLGAYTQDLHEVPATVVRRAGAEVFGTERAPPWLPATVGVVAALMLASSALALWRYAPRLLAGNTVSQASTKPTSPVASAPATARSVGAIRLTSATTAPAPLAPSVSAPALAAPSTAPTAQLMQLLSRYQADTDTDSAFAALFGLWKARYLRGVTDGCSQAAAQGLQCLMRRGSLAQLRLLNRPAILMLSDEQGIPYQVVLRGLEGDAVLLQIGGHQMSVAIADLSRYWFGDFVLLWHPPSPDPAGLRLGMRGPAVRQLRQQLARWRGMPDDADDSDRYDMQLQQAVELFQHANRLTVDGIAGLDTQVALDAVLATPGSPLLQARVQPRPSASVVRGG